MKLGKVIGNVVSTVKDPGLDSIRLLVVQGLDDNLDPYGTPYVAADGILTAGPGDIVYLVSKKEAALVFSKELVPIDECIVGFVDEHFVTKRAKRKPRKKKAPPPTIPLKNKHLKKPKTPPTRPAKKLQADKPTSPSEDPETPKTRKKTIKKPRSVKKKVPTDVRPKTKTPSQRRETK
jgi:ethanolamine utilization protein EutN